MIVIYLIYYAILTIQEALVGRTMFEFIGVHCYTYT